MHEYKIQNYDFNQQLFDQFQGQHYAQDLWPVVYASNVNAINEIMQIFLNSNIRNCFLSIQYSEDLSEIEKVFELFDMHSSVMQITLFNSPTCSISQQNRKTIIYTTDKLRNESDCGRISPFYFESNFTQFNNRAFNTCLKGKLSVDRFGNIKLCPSMKSGFGKVNSISLKKMLVNKKVQKIQNINKDEILVCKDCEFRYICTDCRAITEDGGLYSKPKKCNYDPYTANWE
jgi:SPASM domain peptide maturase of grasp-with-spasm system